MFGLIGKTRAKPGKRDELIELYLTDVRKMPGCRSYVIATDPTDDQALWIAEVWEDHASHQASVKSPAVLYAMPLVASLEEHFQTWPVGGHGPGGPNADLSGTYGLIGKMRAHPEKRDELLALLLAEVGEMPGCFSYIVAKDGRDDDAIWITEVWDSEASHKASLAIPAVRATIARAMPLIAGFGERFVTRPVGGHGLR